MNRYLNLTIFSLAVFSIAQADQYGFTDSFPEVYETIEVLPANRKGWYLHEPLKDLCEQKNIQTAVEVGVWLGHCTIFLAELLPENAKIFAVDHWKGSSEHQDPYNFGEYVLLPTLYQQFLSNIIHYGFTEKVIPVRMDSVNAAKKFRDLKIRPDLIYIDAGHDYKSVYSDVEAWFPLLSENGVMCGDDWNLGDVPRAVKDFAAKIGLKVCFIGEFWWYERK